MRTMLDTVTSGKQVNVTKIASGLGLRRKLIAMELYEGATIKVLRNDMCCPLILEILGTRVAVSRGQARKISVQWDE